MGKFGSGAAAVGRFVIVFGLLMAPWPGGREVIRSFFHSELRWLATWVVPRMVVRVEVLQDAAHEEIDTQVSMADPRKIQPDGSVEVSGVNLDTRSVGWIPQVMLLALIAATPMRWGERFRASVIGLLLLNGVMLLTFAAALAFAHKAGHPAWVHPMLSHIYEVTIQNLWFSFLFPTVLWSLLCFEVKARK